MRWRPHVRDCCSLMEQRMKEIAFHRVLLEQPKLGFVADQADEARLALSIVAPCYNEAPVLREFHGRVSSACRGEVGEEYEVVRRSRLFGQVPERNKLKAGSRLLVSPFPEIKFILSCCGVL